jgi:hypothetical protein
MSLVLELSADSERQLREEAGRLGQAPEEFARTAVEERLAALQQNHGGRLAALMRQWREEPPDLEEAEGYPAEIVERAEPSQQFRTGFRPCGRKPVSPARTRR